MFGCTHRDLARYLISFCLPSPLILEKIESKRMKKSCIFERVLPYDHGHIEFLKTDPKLIKKSPHTIYRNRKHRDDNTWMDEGVRMIDSRNNSHSRLPPLNRKR